ncbi:hypothetical protein OKW98_15595 [Pseudomonas sp. KU26590]|uniref:hypothetical protein n=1 Tax=Pseudomonas sp. KU26590 TaxID=2991051 RepID=UPI00223CB2A4|nr:hypothetical protein [Pseudomonas sp. KU26590]UZJ58039.1 hypothetical protein OKW98_15595 [Pseudomonas sp. KU26590]
MTIMNEEVKAVSSFVEGGTADLRTYKFASAELNKNLQNYLATSSLVEAVAVAGNESGGTGDSEAGVQFRLNTTGNIFYSTTSPELEADTKALFNSASVLFAAMTKAMHQAGKTLFDYDSWAQLIGKTGYFVEMEDFQQNLHIEESSITIDTQIVQELLPGVMDNTSTMTIAKAVLGAFNTQLTSKSSDDSTKVGHLLFFCEELFGAPSVSVRIFYATKTTHTQVTSTSCSHTSSVTIDQTQQASTYLFIDPTTISAYCASLNSDQPAYDALVSKMAAMIGAPANPATPSTPATPT